MVAERYRTFWRRFWAGVIDAAIVMSVYWLVDEWQPFGAQPFGRSVGEAVLSVFVFGYGIALHGRYGKTVGKMLTGVTVVTHGTELPIGYRRALLRDSPLVIMAGLEGVFYALTNWTESSPSVGRGMDAFFEWCSFGWFLLEFVTMLANDQRRAVHDFLAGTVVVRDTA